MPMFPSPVRPLGLGRREVMPDPDELERLARERAYRIWLEEGRPEGKWIETGSVQSVRSRKSSR